MLGCEGMRAEVGGWVWAVGTRENEGRKVAIFLLAVFYWRFWPNRGNIE